MKLSYNFIFNFIIAGIDGNKLFVYIDLVPCDLVKFFYPSKFLGKFFKDFYIFEHAILS